MLMIFEMLIIIDVIANEVDDLPHQTFLIHPPFKYPLLTSKRKED